MSEKRFALEYDSNCYKCISDNEQNKLYSSRESICDLLNQLNDENGQLKYDNFMFKGVIETFQKVAISERKKLERQVDEQQATIEHLTKSRDKWRELSNSFSFYCKCYEKAIERAFEEKPYPTEDDINRIYAELEKELEE